MNLETTYKIDGTAVTLDSIESAFRIYRNMDATIYYFVDEDGYIHGSISSANEDIKLEWIKE